MVNYNFGFCFAGTVSPKIVGVRLFETSENTIRLDVEVVRCCCYAQLFMRAENKLLCYEQALNFTYIPPCCS